MKQSQVRLKKIPLEGLINMLVDLYDGGVNYIDILATPGEEQDTINIIVKDEYISNEEEEEDETSPSLSDETLNDLI